MNTFYFAGAVAAGLVLAGLVGVAGLLGMVGLVLAIVTSAGVMVTGRLKDKTVSLSLMGNFHD